MKTFARGLVLLLALLFVAVPASADDAIGKQRFKEGSAAYQQGRYQEAARLFTEAYEADGHAEIMYNVARSYDKAGDLPNALQAYRRYLLLAPKSEARAEVERRISAIKAQIEPDPIQQSVRITSTPSGATVVLDGREVGRTPWTGDVTPGTHVVELSRAGRVTTSKRFVVEPDRARELNISLPKPALVPASLVEESPPPRYAEPFRDEVESEPAVRPLTWVAFGVGAAALGGALAFEIARNKSEERARDARTQIEHREHYEKMEDRRKAAIALGAVGGAALITGTVLFAIDLNRDRRVGIGVGCQDGACGIAARGRLP